MIDFSVIFNTPKTAQILARLFIMLNGCKNKSQIQTQSCSLYNIKKVQKKAILSTIGLIIQKISLKEFDCGAENVELKTKIKNLKKITIKVLSTLN